MLPGMTPRQWGTVLFTVMGIVLIATGAILGLTVLTQFGSDLPGSLLWRFVMLFGVPIGGGFALLALREFLAAKYLRDEPVQPSAMQPPDAVRVAVVVYGVWLMVGSISTSSCRSSPVMARAG
jgi:MFS family permease